MPLAVYPGTFDPFTPGHRDVVARVRLIFEQVVVLVAANPDKEPAAPGARRTAHVRAALPADWGNVVGGLLHGRAHLKTYVC